MSTWSFKPTPPPGKSKPFLSLGPPGFTLLEMMVAVAIIAIALVSVYKLHAQTIGLSAITRFNSTAALLAQSRLALVEARPLADASDDSGDFGSEHPGYTYKIVISDVESEIFKNPGPTLKKIDIEIALNEDEQTYKLSTYRIETE